MTDQQQTQAPVPLPTVFIVDDDEDVRVMVRGVLHDVGYPTLEAMDGDTALAVLQQHPTSLVVLLDILLPYMDGAALLGIVARHPHLALHHAFVLMTGKPIVAFPVLRKLAQDLGAQILPKPFEVAHLLQAVAHAARTLAHSPSMGDPSSPITESP